MGSFFGPGGSFLVVKCVLFFFINKNKNNNKGAMKLRKNVMKVSELIISQGCGFSVAF